MIDVVDDMNYYGDEQFIIVYLMMDIVVIDLLDDWFYFCIIFKIWDEVLQGYRIDLLFIGVTRGLVKLSIFYFFFYCDSDSEFINNDDIIIIVEIFYIGLNGEILSFSGDFEVLIE